MHSYTSFDGGFTLSCHDNVVHCTAVLVSTQKNRNPKKGFQSKVYLCQLKSDPLTSLLQISNKLTII